MIVRRLINTHEWTGRSGTATVELALTLPILFTIVFGTVEVCQLINLMQSLELAAYEGGRLAIRRDATSALVIARVQSICVTRGVSNPTIAITPAGLAGVTTGTQVQVSVSANWQNNGLKPLVLNSSMVLTGTMTLIAE